MRKSILQSNGKQREKELTRDDTSTLFSYDGPKSPVITSSCRVKIIYFKKVPSTKRKPLKAPKIRIDINAPQKAFMQSQQISLWLNWNQGLAPIVPVNVLARGF